MVLAVGVNGELGDSSRPDGLPWERNPEDMKHFASLTKGNVVVYGGNTFRQFQKMGMENGLPDRHNYVLSSEISEMSKTGYNNLYVNYNMEHTCRLGNLPWILSRLQMYKVCNKEVFVIGGKSIYEQLHRYCDKVYLTRINQEFPQANVRIDLAFLKDFKLVGIKNLNDYSKVEMYEREVLI